MPPRRETEPSTAIVLAGGFSRRMGEPKALLPIGGVTLVERVLGRLASAGLSVVVVAQTDLVLPFLPKEVRLVRDPLPDAGPLVGVAAGLAALEATDAWAYVCSVDAPFLSPAVLERMAVLRDGFEAVVPRLDNDGYPLMALYATSLATRAAELVQSGERRARMLAQRSNTRFVSRQELLDDFRVQRDDPDLATFLSMNTRADWEDATSRVEELDGRRPKRD